VTVAHRAEWARSTSSKTEAREEEVLLSKGRGGRAARLAVLRLGGLALALAMPPVSWAGDGVVRVVLFSSPTCPHCQKVREEVLPALAVRFAGQLQVAVLSTATPSGRDIYWSAFWRYGVQQRGVPLLVVGDFALVGSVEIPQRLPTLIESYLAEGGVDWPPLPGLEAPVAAATTDPPVTEGLEPAPATEPTPATPAPAAQETPAVAVPAAAAQPGMDGSAPPAPATVPLASPDRAASETRTAEPSTAAAPAFTPPVLLAIDDGGLEPLGPLDRLRADPQGNGLALLVLLGMVAAVLRSVSVLRHPARATRTNGFDWLTPLLALAGLGVAAYLAHVEVREVEAVCGPVGDCNTVQQSEYARLFGVIPIGVLGVLGFAAIVVAWGVRRWGAGPAASWAAVALLSMTGLGTLFSIYLTFLEPFVIGASCLWCLSSAVIMTMLHGLAHAPGRAAAAQLGLRPSFGSSRQAR
jgi:uncharacterized membrane protein